jgi:hypothetical protein
MFASGKLALAALFAVVALTSCAPGPGQSPTTSPTDGSPTSSPPTATAPAIVIGSPAEGETVSVPFTVSGEANTF